MGARGHDRGPPPQRRHPGVRASRHAMNASTGRPAPRAAPADYERVDVGLTLMLLEAALAAGNRPRFVYLSAAGVRGLHDGNAYIRARRRVEAAVQASGLPFTIADRRSSPVPTATRRARSSEPAPPSPARPSACSTCSAPRACAPATARRATPSSPPRSSASPPTHARRTASGPRRTCTMGHVPKASNAGSCASLPRPMDRVRTPDRTDVRTSPADSNWLPKPLHASASAGPSARSPGSSTSRTSSAAPACASPKPSGPTTGIANNIAHGAPKPNIVARWAFIAAR